MTTSSQLSTSRSLAAMIPFQQSPPSRSAFSEGSGPLRAGYFVLGEGSRPIAPSITQPQITIAHSPAQGFNEPLTGRGSSTPHAISESPTPAMHSELVVRRSVSSSPSTHNSGVISSEPSIAGFVTPQAAYFAQIASKCRFTLF